MIFPIPAPEGRTDAVSNCPFLHMVSNCPVSNCPRCQIVLVANCPRFFSDINNIFDNLEIKLSDID